MHDQGGGYFFIHNLINNQNETERICVAAATVWSVTEKNVTNRELARRLGLSEQQVGKFVNHRSEPSLQRLHQIADALGLRVKDLFEPIG